MSAGGVSPLPREARAYQGRPAGVVTRVAAAAVDSAVVSLVLLIGYGGLAVVLFLVDPRGFSAPDLPWLLSVVSWLVVLVAYLTVSWTVSGRTYGCLLLGLRVVGRRGRPLRLTGALARAALYAVFPAGLFWCALNRENRSLQDVLLRTSVVYDWQPRRPETEVS